LADIEHSDDYDFEYVTHAINLNPTSDARGDEFNLYYIPTSYADGGHGVYVGSSESLIRGIISSAGTRTVPGLSLELTCNFIGGYQTEVIVTVTYNDLINEPPDAPMILSGPTSGEPGTEYGFDALAVDPDGNQFYARFAWGNDDTSAWLGPYNSASLATGAYTWNDGGTYDITVQAKDIWDAEGDWSSPYTIEIENPWICGDVNGDQIGPNMADLTYLVQYLFTQGPPPPNLQAANIDGDQGGVINIADLSYLIQYLFRSGPDPIC